MLDWFVESASFMPHGYCLLWRPDLVALHAGSDTLTALSYLTIPAAMIVVLRRRKDITLGPLPWLFVSFILLCGLNHAFATVTLVYPLYGLQGFVKLAMAIVSVATAVAVWPLIPRILAIPSVQALTEKNAALEKTLAEKSRLLEALTTAREELGLSASRLKSALDAIPDGFVIADAEERLVLANEAFREIYKPMLADLPADADFETRLRAGAENGHWDLQDLEPEVWIAKQVEARRSSGEMLLRLADGRWIQRSERALETGERVALHVDVTEHKEREAELTLARDRAQERNRALQEAKARSEHESLHDPLTGLANRRGLDSLMRRRIRAWAAEKGDCGVAVLHIDLDGFKQVNNALGHKAGDHVLIEVAAILRESLRDCEAPARIGGDQFAVIAPYRGDGARLAELAETLLERIARPIRVDGRICRVGASIGVAVSDTAECAALQLLADADAALYRAKSLGRNRYEFFSEELRRERELLRETADEIIAGLDAGTFTPFYQPQICGQSLEVCGAEALARWRHPERGVLSPDAFLPVAEQMALAPAIDRAMLEQAQADLARWDAAGLGPIRMSVNVSARRLSEPGLIDSVSALDLPRERFSFEILESTFLDEIDDLVTHNIDRLKEMGLAIEVDDFGSGHASIIGLTRLKPHRLKIDRRLVAPVTEDPAAARLLGSIFEIGAALGVEIVAEGVETRRHVEAMQALGARVLQGYAFARPMPADAFERYLASEQRRKAG